MFDTLSNIIRVLPVANLADNRLGGHVTSIPTAPPPYFTNRDVRILKILAWCQSAVALNIRGRVHFAVFPRCFCSAKHSKHRPICLLCFASSQYTRPQNWNIVLCAWSFDRKLFPRLSTLVIYTIKRPTKSRFSTYGRNRKWTYAQLLSIFNQTAIHRHTTHSVKTYCALLTSVSNLGKKTPNYCRHIISNCHVIRARLHTTCSDPTETLQLNERPVTGLLYSDAACSKQSVGR